MVFKRRNAWLEQLPEWIRPMVKNQGDRDGDAARIIPCDICKAPVLSAMDDVVAVQADPHGLNASMEADALISGRATYQLWLPEPFHIQRRDQYSIKAWAAGRGPRIVVPAHDCGWVLGIPVPWDLLFSITYRNHQKDGSNEPLF